MNILLVNPHREYGRYLPRRLADACRFTAALEDPEEIWQPLEMAYLASILRRNHQVAFIDAHAERRRLTAPDFDGHQVVVAGTAPFEKWRCTHIFSGHATDLLAEARRAGARTVIYGPHVAVDPDAFGDMDAVIPGEPESVIETAVTSRERGVFGPLPLPPLDEMPAPDYSIFAPRRYDARVLFQGRVKGPFAVVAGSRGCPYSCTFCFKAMVDRRTLRHSPERVEGIVKDLVLGRGYRAIAFADLTFSLDRRWTLDLCRRLMGFRPPYYVSTRCDCVDPEVAEALAGSGCVRVELGVETASDRNLDRLGKQISWRDVEEAVSLCRKAGIPIVSAFRMVFVPGETRATLEELEARCRRLQLDVFPNICTPYPGTPLWEEGVREGKIRPGKPAWEDVVLAAGTVGTSFTREEVTRICDDLAWRSHAPYGKSIAQFLRTHGVAKLLRKLASLAAEWVRRPRELKPGRRYRRFGGRTYILVRLRTLAPAVALDAVGYPLARLARALRRGVRGRGHGRLPSAGDVEKILVIRLDHIGDLVMTSPALRALKALYPHAKISCLAGTWSLELLQTDPNVDSIVEFNSPWFKTLRTTTLGLPKLVRLARRLRPERFDLCVDFRGDPRHLFLGRLTGARWVVGYGVRGGGFLADVVPAYRADAHEVERNLDVVSSLGGRSEPSAPAIYTTEQDDARAEKLMVEQGMDRSRLTVAVCPYSRNPARGWNDAGFTAVCRWFVESLGARVVLFGDEEHAERIAALCRGAGAGVRSLAGKTSLREFAACLRWCDLVVSIESSPMHFASAMGIPIVPLFGGTGLPEHWGPYRVPCRIVRSPAPCAPCFRMTCPRDRVECMEGIRACDVIEAARSLLEETGALKHRTVSDGPAKETGR